MIDMHLYLQDKLIILRKQFYIIFQQVYMECSSLKTKQNKQIRDLMLM